MLGPCKSLDHVVSLTSWAGIILLATTNRPSTDLLNNLLNNQCSRDQRPPTPSSIEILRRTAVIGGLVGHNGYLLAGRGTQ